jgi:hypothetical protein
LSNRFFENVIQCELIQTLSSYGSVSALKIILNGDILSGTKTGYVEFLDSDDGLRKKYLAQEERFVYSIVAFENGNFAVGFSDTDFKLGVLNYHTCILNATRQLP